MSREKISEVIGSLERQADQAVMVQIGSASIVRATLDDILSTCGTLRHLLLEDGRYGYVIEQIGRVQQATRAAGRHAADPGKCRSDLNDAVGRLTRAWRQTASWATEPGHELG